MAGFDDMIAYLEKERLAGSQDKIIKTYRFLYRQLPDEALRTSLLEKMYSSLGSDLYTKLNEMRSFSLKLAYGSRKELKRLGYPISEIKKMPADVIVKTAQEKKKYVDPNAAIVEKEKAHYIDAETRHKVLSEENKVPTPPPKKRIDQQTSRRKAARGARRHLDPNVKATQNIPTLKERIEKRAYSIWEQEGRPHGRSVEHWTRAKSEFIREEAYNIYEARKNTKFVGSPEHDWIKAERRIEKQLNDPKWMNRVSTRKAKIKQALADKNSVEGLLKRAQEAYFKLSPKEKILLDIKGFASGVGEMFSRFKTSQMALRGKNLIANKWFRRGVKGAVGIVAFNLIRGGVQRMISPKPAIPDYYERGYDIISEQGDFGSPINLSKAAHKALRPYHSTVRKALVTDVNSIINRNYALASCKNAIGHTRY